MIDLRFRTLWQPSVQGTPAAPGNIGGINWSGSSYDPQHNLLVVNTNNLIARVRLIPRDKVHSDKEDGSYGWQRGTPYAMPCGAPPWGTLTAVDMEKGTIRWQVPSVRCRILVAHMTQYHGDQLVSGVPPPTEGGLVFIGGTTDSRIQCRNRSGTLECRFTRRRECAPNDLRGPWQTVSCD